MVTIDIDLLFSLSIKCEWKWFEAHRALHRVTVMFRILVEICFSKRSPC